MNERFVLTIAVKRDLLFGLGSDQITPIWPKPVLVRNSGKYVSEWLPGTGGGRTRGGEGAQDAQDWAGCHRGHQDRKQAFEQTL